MPIPGSRSIERLEENAKAAEITLTEDNVKELRGAIQEANIVGRRYPEEYMKTIEFDSIPLSEWKGSEPEFDL